MAIPAFSAAETDYLDNLHDIYGAKVLRTGCNTAAASFLIIGALIVITCASLCFMLPGINAMTDIILPAYVPAALAILSSIPFIVMSVRYTQEKNFIRERKIIKMTSLLDVHRVPEKTRKERIKFILHNILKCPLDPYREGKLDKNTFWTLDYQKKILGDIKEKIGKEKKDRNPRQEKIATAIDDALLKIQQKKKKH